MPIVETQEKKSRKQKFEQLCQPNKGVAGEIQQAELRSEQFELAFLYKTRSILDKKLPRVRPKGL